MTKPLEALISGAVTGSYYLAKCESCQEMFSSGRMTGGEPNYSGDYGDSYCPHCGVDDSEVSDYGNEALEAWNFQQKHIDALIAALEQSQQYAKDRDAENQDLMLTVGRLRAERDALREKELHKATNTRAAADIYFQLIEECEIPPGGSLVQHVEGLKDKIAELEASHEKLRECLAGIHNTIKRDGAYTSLAAILSATNRAYEESATIKPIEASQLAVKLPDAIIDNVCMAASEIHNRGDGVNDDKAQFIIDRIRNYLENGGTVQGDE